MISALHIENYAIIEKVDISLDASLNIFTGETGAGKSIILGALSLIMGQRADTKVLYDSSQKCIVDATFSSFPKLVRKILTEADYDDQEELIIRREISPKGRSRAFINDTPTNLDFLQLLSTNLIDLNQQFQIVDIQKRKFQLSLIDALANTNDLLVTYKDEYTTYKDQQKTLEELEAMESTQLKELDFMKFQLEELEKSGLAVNEQHELESEQKMLAKSDDLVKVMEETKYVLINSESNIKDVLLSLAKKWEGILDVNESIRTNHDSIQDLIENLDEIYHGADSILNQAESNPSKLEEITNRLDNIYYLQKKHGVNSVDALISIQEDLHLKVNAIQDRGGTIKKLKAEIDQREKKLLKQAKQLSAKRLQIFPKFEKEVNKKLVDLAMSSAEIKVVHKESEALRSDGIDDLEIYFKANKGSEFQPIRKVASGGETSRLMLSIKSCVAHAMALPTLIFDEVDTGVSGEVAAKMGGILRDLSKKHQLISITHSPQVSARAVKHFHVYKEETKTRTITRVKVLDKNERINELAKMLSGDPPSTFALKNAKELIKN